MVNSLKHIAVWTIFILSYGHLAAAADIESRLADLEELAAKVELSVHTNTAQLDKPDFRVHELQDGTRLEGEKIRRVADPNIGFDARVHIHAAAIHLHDHQTVRFNHVLINQGKGYNRTTGRFTCPQHVALESLAPNVNALANANGDELQALEKDMAKDLLENTRQHALTNRRSSNNTSIGFDVHVHSGSSSGPIHVANRHTVKFNNVVFNHGNGYDNVTGKFTCPIHGLYQFASTIPSGSKATIDCELVMSNHQLARLHANRKGFDQASQVLVVECAAGHKVWVRHLNGANDSGDLATKLEWATFSGHLVTAL
ncbi:uncharacterized protein LOC117326549 [Pecten maximus]|uniref:uncharacterized protein LOC117326549 n=1 Tax=Pecten maximus TaxID=6579 RepID=UPI001458C59E|nr:uncharacterized protein LOC117326549 [Pecten maximus]